MSRRGQVPPSPIKLQFTDFDESTVHVGIKCPRPRWNLDQHGGAQRILIHSSPAGGVFCAAVFGARRLRCAVQTPFLGHFAGGPPLSCFLSFSLVCLRSALFARPRSLPRCLVWRLGSEFFSASFERTTQRLAPNVGTKKCIRKCWRKREEAFQRRAANQSEIAACACTMLALLRVH